MIIKLDNILSRLSLTGALRTFQIVSYFENLAMMRGDNHVEFLVFLNLSATINDAAANTMSTAVLFGE